LIVTLGRNGRRHGWLVGATIHFLLLIGTYLVFLIFFYVRNVTVSGTSVWTFSGTIAAKKEVS
jgi:uncharacterized membrane protein